MELQSVKQRFGIVGNSNALNTALNTATQVAPTDLTVLISGESGVGKEIFSQVLHQLSKRKHEQSIAVNCGAIPEGTIDSELFGHEKGAFTGAHDSRKGYFEAVNGGTIFLDEISEMPLGTQARLLRVLETGEFIKVGSSKVQKTDVRVITASNKNLISQIENGKFREDLYYRLNTIQIKIPSLRDRKEDIHLLFRKFCVDFAEKYNTSPVQLSPDAVEVLNNYKWPGNIRQLKHIAEQVSVLSKSKVLDAESLNQYIPKEAPSQFAMVKWDESVGNKDNQFSEREILYRVLFDLKKDVHELKKVVVDLNHGEIHVSEDNKQQKEILISDWKKEVSDNAHTPQIVVNDENKLDEPGYNERFNDAEVIEESLSIADKEKELIIKALKKHNSRRKEAANDLGISERTLYRKIKDYELDL